MYCYFIIPKYDISLNELCLKNKDVFTLEFILKIMIGIIKALRTMHIIGYTHNDIKDNNIMINNIHSDEVEVVLIDYGYAKKIIDSDRNHIKERT